MLTIYQKSTPKKKKCWQKFISAKGMGLICLVVSSRKGWGCSLGHWDRKELYRQLWEFVFSPESHSRQPFSPSGLTWVRRHGPPMPVDGQPDPRGILALGWHRYCIAEQRAGRNAGLPHSWVPKPALPLAGYTTLWTCYLDGIWQTLSLRLFHWGSRCRSQRLFDRENACKTLALYLVHRILSFSKNHLGG